MVLIDRPEVCLELLHDILEYQEAEAEAVQDERAEQTLFVTSTTFPDLELYRPMDRMDITEDLVELEHHTVEVTEGPERAEEGAEEGLVVHWRYTILEMYRDLPHLLHEELEAQVDLVERKTQEEPLREVLELLETKQLSMFPLYNTRKIYIIS